MDEEVLMPYLVMIRFKWHELGSLLGVSHEELAKLHGEPGARLRKVISMWLSGQCSKPPTLDTLTGALRHSSIDEDNVATAIEQGNNSCYGVVHILDTKLPKPFRR